MEKTELIQVAFYKGKGDLTDWAIRKWTRSPYSHCEIVIDGIWYASSPRSMKIESRRIYPRKESWDYIDIDGTTDDVARIKDLFYRENGKGYDWLGIMLSMILPLNVHSKNKWFCSEISAEALKKVGIGLTKQSNWYSPGRLYKALEELI